MNMAGAMAKAPCLFVCENNQWAISTNLRGQTASENIHIKAKAYGMPGFYVDGNDIVAVMEVCTHAAEWVRAGNGPALVECLTYRVGSHSNADADAEKNYRTRDEVQEWLGRDPIVRVESLLAHLGHPIDAEERAGLIAAVHRDVDEQVHPRRGHRAARLAHHVRGRVCRHARPSARGGRHAAGRAGRGQQMTATQDETGHASRRRNPHHHLIQAVTEALHEETGA